MPNNEQKKVCQISLLPNNSAVAPVARVALDFSNSKVIRQHMEREGNGIKIIEDGIEDTDALIQSEKINAGLENIIRLQTMRYGTIENAIKRNEDKQTFADVSNIPTSVAEQTEFVASVQADVDALCAKLGITKEQLLQSNLDTLNQLLAAKQAAPAATETGGNE